MPKCHFIVHLIVFLAKSVASHINIVIIELLKAKGKPSLHSEP